MRIHREKDFISMFDEKTGHYIRTGIIKNGRDTGVDPFMSSFPELLDVGIMGHCKHGQSGRCLKSGVECYQDGLHATAPNMTVEDFSNIASQCRGKTFQFALGGCGDPDQHEHFAEILEICKQNQIVPNFTTSGFGLTKELAELCAKYCGAVAVSWYRSSYTLEAIELLLAAHVKTNIHYVLNNESVAEALDRLQNQKFPSGINAIVFLLHKPVGLGSVAKMITLDNAEFQQFIAYIGRDDVPYKIGFDSCTIPAILQQPGTISLDSLDTCEGARWSAYVTSDCKLLPCSFDNQKMRWAVDLRTSSIAEAWMSEPFQDFRARFKNACPNCAKRVYCLGGCPICPEIVLCRQKENSALTEAV